MTDELTKELRGLCANQFTGTISLHIERGAVKLYEINERRRPKADDGKVELSEVKGAGVDSGHERPRALPARSR